jgi:uncharacterized protein YkwD
VRSAAAVEQEASFSIVIKRVPDAPAAVENAPRNPPPDNPPRAGIATHSAAEQQVVDLVNQERRKMGLPPLRVSARLAQAARQHSQNMARQNTGAHELDGVGPGERIRETGYRALQWGENIAWGARTAEQAMSGWMNSPGHRRNILSAEVSEIGVGLAEANGVPYWTQVFGRPWE